MDLAKARAFLATHNRAILVTRLGDRVFTSPVLVALDADGDAIVSSRETAYKTKHLRRDPRVSLCVMSDAFYGEWVHIDGTATVLGLPDALEPLVDYYRRSSGEHPDWDEYRQAMRDEKRVLLKIAIERAGPDRTG